MFATPIAFLLLIIIVIIFDDVSAATSTIFNLNATRDNYIEERSGFQNVNYGVDTSLYAGVDDGKLSRVLVGFDLSSVAFALSSTSGGSAQKLKLVKASLILEIQFELDTYIHCTTTGDTSTPNNCATVHMVTTAWGEGTTFDTPASNGASSWIHSAFPTQWETPGGDFQEAILGRRAPSPKTIGDNAKFASFPLDVILLQPLLVDVDAPGSLKNLGFLLRNDENGVTAFRSHNGYEGSPPGAPPRLQLEFEEAANSNGAPPTVVTTTTINSSTGMIAGTSLVVGVVAMLVLRIARYYCAKRILEPKYLELEATKACTIELS